MNIMQVKGMVVMLVFVCLAGVTFVAGCAADRKTAATSLPQVCVIDLKNDPEYQKLLGGGPQTCGMRAGRVYLKPGETCGRHTTGQHEEMLVFLSGEGAALIGENESPLEVGRGKISYIPPHTIHNVKNTGTEPLVYIYCVTPVTLNGEDRPEHNDHHH
jgi:mannose-6-phosphate isomerase-like protein (cupin superfamily)